MRLATLSTITLFCCGFAEKCDISETLPVDRFTEFECNFSQSTNVPTTLQFKACAKFNRAKGISFATYHSTNHDCEFTNLDHLSEVANLQTTPPYCSQAKIMIPPSSVSSCLIFSCSSDSSDTSNPPKSCLLNVHIQYHHTNHLKQNYSNINHNIVLQQEDSGHKSNKIPNDGLAEDLISDSTANEPTGDHSGYELTNGATNNVINDLVNDPEMFDEPADGEPANGEPAGGEPGDDGSEDGELADDETPDEGDDEQSIEVVGNPKNNLPAQDLKTRVALTLGVIVIIAGVTGIALFMRYQMRNTSRHTIRPTNPYQALKEHLVKRKEQSENNPKLFLKPQRPRLTDLDKLSMIEEGSELSMSRHASVVELQDSMDSDMGAMADASIACSMTDRLHTQILAGIRTPQPTSHLHEETPPRSSSC